MRGSGKNFGSVQNFCFIRSPVRSLSNHVPILIDEREAARFHSGRSKESELVLYAVTIRHSYQSSVLNLYCSDLPTQNLT
jgi:hypothetical protein